MIHLPDNEKLRIILSGKYHFYDKNRISFVAKVMSSILFNNNIDNKYIHNMISISTLSKLYMDSGMNTYYKGNLNKYIASSIIGDFWYTMNSIMGYSRTLKYIQYNYPLDIMCIKISKGEDPFNTDKFGYKKDIKWDSECKSDKNIGIKKCIDLDKCSNDLKLQRKCLSPYIINIDEFAKLPKQEQVLQLRRELELGRLTNSKQKYDFIIDDSMNSSELKKIKILIQDSF